MRFGWLFRWWRRVRPPARPPAAPAAQERQIGKFDGHYVKDCGGHWIDVTSLSDVMFVEKCSRCRATRRLDHREEDEP